MESNFEIGRDIENYDDILGLISTSLVPLIVAGYDTFKSALPVFTTSTVYSLLPVGISCVLFLQPVKMSDVAHSNKVSRFIPELFSLNILWGKDKVKLKKWQEFSLYFF